MARRSLTGDKPSTRLAAERWVRRAEDSASQPALTRAEEFGARLTIDVTTDLRGRIKIAAYRRGSTVANMLRQVLEREFGEDVDRV